MPHPFTLTLPGALAVLALLCGPTGALAQEGRPDAGRTLAETNCVRCHAIGMEGTSPITSAPAFRDLHRRYPVDHLAEALAEGIGTGHAAMPEFKFDPADITDFLAYLKTLER